MKKLICLMLVFIIALCGCSRWSVEIVDPTKPVESESELEDSEERKPVEVLNERQQKAIKSITEYELNNVIWDELRAKGIVPSFTKIEFYDEENWSGVILLEKSGKILEIPVEGIASYTEDDHVFNNYGTISFLDEKNAVFCGKEKAFFFSTETLEPLDINLEIPVFEGEETWINGVGFNEQTEKYILFATGIKRPEVEKEFSEMFFYDENGKIESSMKTSVSGTSKCLDEYLLRDFRQTKFFEFRGETFVHTGYEATGLESGAEIDFYDETNLKNGDYNLKITGCSVSGTEETRSYMAFLSENGKNEKIMMFDGSNFSDPNYSGESEPPTFEVNGDIVTYRHDYFAMTMVLDFAKQSQKIKYEPTDAIIDEDTEKSKSADGKYSIHTFGLYGAGDVLNYHISVRNNETGNHIYLGTGGGMYGGSGGYGFLKNNDIYFYSLSDLTIHNPETGEVIFSIDKNFPLGFNKATEIGRGLLTFRRDPKDFSFIVVYFEYEKMLEWHDYEGNPSGDGFGNCNYKIGFLDSEGNLLESYDTKYPIISDPFGLCNVDMRYSEEELTLIVSGRRGETVFSGIFDMETKEFRTKRVIEE
ncbi:MAG: hypothetical protein IJO22_05265 [Oscillospiraceae bacterium]|nr:hypothetical protein [Oscillospiraceae bacterium]